MRLKKSITLVSLLFAFLSIGWIAYQSLTLKPDEPQPAFPQPPIYRHLQSLKVSAPAEGVRILHFETTDSSEDVRSFYARELTSAGWRHMGTGIEDGYFYPWGFKSRRIDFYFYISTSPKESITQVETRLACSGWGFPSDYMFPLEYRINSPSDK